MGTNAHNICRLRRTVLLSAASLALYSRLACPENFECSPNSFPVRNFAREVLTAQEDARELANYMHAAEWNSLDVSLRSDLERLKNAPLLPPLYAGKPVTAFLQEVVNNSTIFNWEDNAADNWRGTASVLRDTERDIRNQRVRVLAVDSDSVAAMQTTIADARKASSAFEPVLGLLTKLRNETEQIRGTYSSRAFSHLSSCLTSCAGPKGYDLAAFHRDFAELYAKGTSKAFPASAQALADARASVELLPKALDVSISTTQTESFSTTIVGAKQAANLKSVADVLADAQRGSWSTVGNQNDQIRRAIGMLSVGFGWMADGRPDPTGLINTAVDRAAIAQASIDSFVQTHSKLLGELQAFLDQYQISYQPGCRAKNPDRAN